MRPNFIQDNDVARLEGWNNLRINEEVIHTNVIVILSVVYFAVSFLHICMFL